MKKETLQAIGINVSEDLNAHELFRMRREELMEPETAYRINALKEICMELNESIQENRETITTSCDAARLIAPSLRYLNHEECWIILLDKGNGVIRKEMITVGTVDTCQFDTLRITKSGILADASGIIVCHNHPSGSVNPSNADIKMTEKLKKALHYFNINLIDHIIIGLDRYYSFSDEHATDLWPK